MTSDKYILHAILGYKIPLKSNVYQSKLPNVKEFTKDEMHFLKMEINRLQDLGVIKKTKKSFGQFVSGYFLVKKSNGKFRFILNLKFFNDFVHTEHFKLEDIRTVVNILEYQDYMCSIDLKDAYFLIPIDKAYWKYLRFCFENQLFEFTCLPFGLSTCPYIYSKVIKVAIAYLRSKGIRITNYLDDILIFGRSREECLINLNTTIKLLTELGFIINYEKSRTEPDTNCKYLGFIINSRVMSLELTKEKKNKIKTTIENIIKKQTCKYSELLSLIGTLVAACPAVKWGWLFYKELETLKCAEGPIALCDKNRTIKMSNLALKDLRWWNENILSSNNKIRTFQFDKEIFSDASLSGWGAICNGTEAHGFWNVKEKSNHINYLELLAAYLALKSFADKDHDCQILLRIDNIVAISYINKMGGIKFPYLNEITRDIWEWCIERNNWIFAEYVASKENPADKESRISNIDTEWELADYAFNIITKEFGNPDIDLFATRINKKCKIFCSWQRDPEAHVINAFTLKWSNFFWYAFPPFALINKVLRKVCEDRTTGIIVVPDWYTQPWYPKFRELLISEPITFAATNDLLLSPCRTIAHPLWNQLNLIVGVISGKSTRERS